jgi:hypothetical protein
VVLELLVEALELLVEAPARHLTGSRAERLQHWIVLQRAALLFSTVSLQLQGYQHMKK